MNIKHTTLLVLTIIISGCSTTPPEDKTSKKPVSVSSTASYFEDRIGNISDSLSVWGFEALPEEKLSNTNDYSNHWWLKAFTQLSPGINNQENFPAIIIPDSLDYNKIDHIRQLTYKKSWEYIIEEWSFKDPNGADRWLNIAVKAQESDDFKPPRVFWAKNNKLYFIMATAANDWTEHSNEIITLFNGNTRWLIELMNEPIGLNEFINKSKARDGREGKALDYYYKPDSAGVYMHYQEFEGLDTDAQKNSVVLTTFKTNNQEELIAIRGALNHATLNQLSIVGRSKSDLENWLGKDYHTEGSSILYNQNHSFLVITFQNDKAVWFDFFKANNKINGIADLPGYEVSRTE